MKNIVLIFIESIFSDFHLLSFNYKAREELFPLKKYFQIIYLYFHTKVKSKYIKNWLYECLDTMFENLMSTM